VIVDEIHAIAGSKRGTHLALSLERLASLSAHPPVRIGLSATQKPLGAVADFLCGTRAAEPCTIVDTGHIRHRDLALEIPSSPLEAVMAGEVWEETYDRLAQLIAEHRTTLVFVNTRRMAERAARHLSERVGDEFVTSHHGSMSREKRFDAEQRLKDGALKALVATASLELGIDIGEVDLVCQLGTTRSISTFLQRVGRSGHGLGRTPKGRIFPLSRDELVEAVALVAAVKKGELDRICIPEMALDVLSQQIVATLANEEWSEDALYDLLRGAWPYRSLAREKFDQVVRMLADGFATRRGRRSAYIYRDAVNHRLRARPGARLTAVTCGGAIPDAADYEVRADPGGTFVGTVDEDFAVESLAGDIFQLGNTSWRVLRVETGTVRVADAHGQPPNIPFWMGEAPARTPELSRALSRLRAQAEQIIEGSARPTDAVNSLQRWLSVEMCCSPAAALQIAEYLSAAHAVFGALPTRDQLIMERFFDESGGMQLIIHAPYGSRLNRAWGLALRKRFCRQFNFELQAAATEDAIVLSLGETHSFALEDVWHYLKSESVREVLTQALLDAPMFTTRWRWTACCALALKRFHNGQKVPARLLRMQAEDLAAVVFPDQLACAENIRGRREIPDHPLVEQAIAECLHDAMDIDALEALLGRITAGDIQLLARDLTEPSPLAQEILTAKPYAYLDDAPLEERRTQAVISRRWLDPEKAADIGRLDPAAIAAVRDEAWPVANDADEFHDALMTLGFLSRDEVRCGLPTRAGGGAGDGYPTAIGSSWEALAEELATTGRAALLNGAGEQPSVWVATERLPQMLALFPDAACHPEVLIPEEFRKQTWTRDEALLEIVRGRLGGLGPVTLTDLAETLAIEAGEIDATLFRLEHEGFAMRGRFTRADGAEEWCDRRLLARIHRYTVGRLRREIEPVAASDYMRFLLQWQHLAPGTQLEGPRAIDAVMGAMQGFECPAAAWEQELLPSRIKGYAPVDLDNLCLSGRYVWGRLSPLRTSGDGERGVSPLKTTPIALVLRKDLASWRSLAGALKPEQLTIHARSVLGVIDTQGACFYDDLMDATGLLRAQLEHALAELVARGLIRSDSFQGLRALLAPAGGRRNARRGRRRRGTLVTSLDEVGRWVSMAAAPAGGADEAAIENFVWALLGRYGVVFRRLLARELSLAPWHAQLRVLRRLEARGEIRGGRFIAGPSGEQFALPEAVDELRAVRRRAGSGELVSVCAVDPANLIGILMPGPRLPALLGNRVLYRDGVPVALQIGKEVRLLGSIDDASEWTIRNALIRTNEPRPLHDRPRASG